LNGKQPGRLVDERAELFGAVLYRFGSPPVGADTERVSRRNLQQVSGFGE
jgi:hypothetical protein